VAQWAVASRGWRHIVDNGGEPEDASADGFNHIADAGGDKVWKKTTISACWLAWRIRTVLDHDNARPDVW